MGVSSHRGPHRDGGDDGDTLNVTEAAFQAVSLLFGVPAWASGSGSGRHMAPSTEA